VDQIASARESQRLFHDLRLKIARLGTAHVNKGGLLMEIRGAVDRTSEPTDLFFYET
jgi:hypothetical protein